MSKQKERNALADKLANVESYTNDDLQGYDQISVKTGGRFILVSEKTRVAVIAALRGKA